MKKLVRNFLIVFVLTLLFTNITFAQEVASESAKNNYQLPYPGILPDSLLYGLKVFRDRLIALFISDPVKKSEFDLLQADKRLSSGIALFDKGKQELSETTISKGENYFEDSLKNVRLAKGGGKELDPTFLTNLELSSKKHEKVISDLVKRSNGGLRAKFEKTLNKVHGFVKQAIEIKL